MVIIPSIHAETLKKSRLLRGGDKGLGVDVPSVASGTA
jgi:hypothetical protein